MSSTTLKEAERVMTICNACRYCEGFCAVFPAMELRRVFTDQDLTYLANLCHNCRGCYYACQYAPPHEFALNVPRALGELRMDTYREFCWPGGMKTLFKNNVLVVGLIAVICVIFAILSTLLFRGNSLVFTAHIGEGAFYKVIPYAAMTVPFSLLTFWILTALFKGFANLWRATGGTYDELTHARAHMQAIWDVLRLKYLDGGGHGCNYPDDRFSMGRRWFHHAVFYGFLLCFASTTVAFFYDHLLHLPAPYPFWSWPVLLGTAGGLAILGGTAGMFYLKSRMDRNPGVPEFYGMDITFTCLLFLTSLTGLLLMVLRTTSMMGMLLVTHLGVVFALFITMPYGKFVHAIYRYAALVRNAIEQSSEENRG